MLETSYREVIDTRKVGSLFYVCMPFLSFSSSLFVSLSCIFTMRLSWSIFSAIVASRSVVFADIFPLYRDTKHQDGDLGSYPAQRFISEPDIIAPVPNILVEPSEEVSPNEYVSWAPVGHYTVIMKVSEAEADAAGSLSMEKVYLRWDRNSSTPRPCPWSIKLRLSTRPSILDS